jgi:hypothetical protein
MAQLRFEALKKLSERTRVHADLPSTNVSKFFGENVYGPEQMRATLAPGLYKKVSHGRCSCISCKVLGYCQGRNTLHTLVPTDDRWNCREARFIL